MSSEEPPKLSASEYFKLPYNQIKALHHFFKSITEEFNMKNTTFKALPVGSKIEYFRVLDRIKAIGHFMAKLIANKSFNPCQSHIFIPKENTNQKNQDQPTTRYIESITFVKSIQQRESFMTDKTIKHEDIIKNWHTVCISAQMPRHTLYNQGLMDISDSWVMKPAIDSQDEKIKEKYHIYIQAMYVFLFNKNNEEIVDIKQFTPHACFAFSVLCKNLFFKILEAFDQVTTPSSTKENENVIFFDASTIMQAISATTELQLLFTGELVTCDNYDNLFFKHYTITEQPIQTKQSIQTEQSN